MNIKQTPKAIAVHMDDDVLACHIKDVVDAIVPILVAVYVTGLVAGDYIRMSITWVTEQVSRLGVAATSTEEVETEPRL